MTGPARRAQSGAAALAVPALLAVLWAPGAARADSLRYCDKPPPLAVEQQDAVFRFASVVKGELEASGEPVALVSRAAVSLGLVGLRYSHAGISLKASANGPWSVRQLYYACDEQAPRLFDQGITGFLLGGNDAGTTYVSIVFVPPDAAARLAQWAGSNPSSLDLLAGDYSANAYAFSTRYQNCNQWVAEMLAMAWSGAAAGDAAARPAADTATATAAARGQAQQWLRASGYAPVVFELWPPLMAATRWSPWIHTDDHPAQDLARSVYKVSMPWAIEDFVRRFEPGARRVELCRSGRRVVIHRGWSALADGCQPGEGDEVRVLD